VLVLRHLSLWVSAVSRLLVVVSGGRELLGELQVRSTGWGRPYCPVRCDESHL